jgi:Tat protein translocase TatB subunit
MDFLGIGPPEIILVLIIAIIVVGPKRLPEVAVHLARAIRRLRGYATDVTAQMRSEIDELTREYEQIRKELQEFRESTSKDIDSATREVGHTVREVGHTVREVDRTVREAPAIIESSTEPEPKKPPSPPQEKTTPDDGS